MYLLENRPEETLNVVYKIVVLTTKVVVEYIKEWYES